MARITAMDVIEYFKNADLEVAELALHVATSTVNEKVAKRAAASDRMAKARAGRKPRGARAAAAQATTENAAPATPATPAPHANVHPTVEAARGRRVQAPAHTAAATSVESDSVVA